VSFTFDQPIPLKIHKVEKKRELPASDGRPPKVILRLGVEQKDGFKGWVELFADLEPTSWPKAGSIETLILKRPDDPEWAPTARRSGQQRKGGGGGFRRDPIEDAATQANIAHQSSLKAAVDVVSMAEDRPKTVDDLVTKVLGVAGLLTDSVLERGEQERKAARAR
jgi:hypothetical protein